MWHREHDAKSFIGVAIAFIIVGAAIFAFGSVAWLVNAIGESVVIAIPSIKIMGGILIMLLGYIMLELELMRKKG
jgi:hypothetical protein